MRVNTKSKGFEEIALLEREKGLPSSKDGKYKYSLCSTLAGVRSKVRGPKE